MDYGTVFFSYLICAAPQSLTYTGISVQYCNHFSLNKSDRESNGSTTMQPDIKFKGDYELLAIKQS